jgi:hypothetical protein
MLQLTDASANSLVLKLTQRLVKGTIAVFALKVTNPLNEQPALAPLLTGSTGDGTYQQLAVDKSIQPDLSTILNETGAVQGDAAPLKIYSPALIVRFLGQSTSYPRVSNTLTLTIACNLKLTLTDQHVIVLSNLVGVSAPDFSDSLQTHFSPTFVSDTKLLELSLKQDLAVGTIMVWSFTFNNPVQHQVAPLIKIKVIKRVPGQADALVIPESTATSHETDAFKKPLVVQQLSFTSSKAEQGSALPIAINEIFLRIGTSIALPVGTNVYVSGFWDESNHSIPKTAVSPCSEASCGQYGVSGEAGTNRHVPITDESFGCNHHRYFTGRWDPSNASLVLQVNHVTQHAKEYTLSFRVSNPKNEQNASVLKLSGSNDGLGLVMSGDETDCPTEICETCIASIRDLPKCQSSQCVTNLGECQTDGNVPEQAKCLLCVPGTKEGDAAPLSIYPFPQFAYSAIGQTEHLPNRANLLTVTLETNVVLSKIYTSLILVESLTSIDDDTSIVKLFSDDPGRSVLSCSTGDACNLFRACIDPVSPQRCPQGTAAWDNDRKVLRLYVEEKLPIIYHYNTRPLSFAFSLVNAKQLSGVSISPLVSAIGVSHTGTEVDMIEPTEMPTGLGFTWLSLKQIGQNNSYPSAPNTLTITLQTTQAISEKTGLKIIVTGLIGKTWYAQKMALIDPHGNGHHLWFMDAFPGGSPGFGRWGIIDNKPSLHFFLAQNWPGGVPVVLSFQVQNQRTPVDINAEQVTISFEPMVSAYTGQISQLVLDKATIEKVDMDYDLETVLNVVGAVKGDAHPLVILQPQFTFTEIFQQSAIPKDQSIVTLRFATSISLGINDTLALSLQKAELQNVWIQESGMITLSGPHAHYFSMSTSLASPTLKRACWSTSRDAGVDGEKLMLFFARNTQAGFIYEVSFAMTNPLPAQAPVSAYLTALKMLSSAQFKVVAATGEDQLVPLSMCAKTEEADDEGKQVAHPNSWARCSSCTTLISNQDQKTGKPKAIPTPSGSCPASPTWPTGETVCASAGITEQICGTYACCLWDAVLGCQSAAKQKLCNDNVQSKLLCQDHAILQVNTGYVVKNIKQMTALPGAANIIMVRVEVNVMLPGTSAGLHTKLTISGLSGGKPKRDGKLAANAVGLETAVDSNVWDGAQVLLFFLGGGM